MGDVQRAAALHRAATADPAAALPELRRGVADPDELVRLDLARGASPAGADTQRQGDGEPSLGAQGRLPRPRLRRGRARPQAAARRRPNHQTPSPASAAIEPRTKLGGSGTTANVVVMS